MMDESFYSVRMRASTGARHLGGAERLVEAHLWAESMQHLLQRALAYEQADEISLQWDPVSASKIERLPALPVTTVATHSVGEAREEATKLLLSAGVSYFVAIKAMKLLDRGPGPGGVPMRGGVIMDAVAGRRLEPNPARGVRATRMDYTPLCRQQMISYLESHGLTSHRVWEAVALATKAAWSGAVAELGWSDDPNYVAGYVASANFGYCRFKGMKEAGVPRGGRVFFLDRADAMERFMGRMEHAPLLIDRVAVLEDERRANYE